MSSHLQKIVYDNALKAFRSGLMAGTSGNFSAYDRQLDIMAITPSGIDYDVMTSADIAIVAHNGQLISGTYAPSSEWQMHLLIYQKMTQITGIAHTHSPYATAFAVINETIPMILIEMILLGGAITVAPFALPGSVELGQQVVNTLTAHNISACLLENHGALAVGANLDQALTNAIYLEDAAKIYHYAKIVGKVQLVSDEHIQAMRTKLGL